MVYVFYTFNDKPFTQEKWDKSLSTLPDLFKNKILKFIRWEDRQNSLTGKLLLKYGLENLYYPSKKINSVQLSSFGKPFIYNNDACFNISHSDSCSVCAFNLFSDIRFGTLSEIGDIGIDIEFIKPIAVEDFFSVFTEKEKYVITNSTDSLRSFYKIWTRKESVVKAQGKGLSTPLNTFCVSSGAATLNNNIWHTYPIDINSEYICHIAVREVYPKIYIEYINPLLF